MIRLHRYFAVHPSAAVPSSEDHGERSVLPLGQEQHIGQMAEECLPSGNRCFLLSAVMGGQF